MNNLSSACLNIELGITTTTMTLKSHITTPFNSLNVKILLQHKRKGSYWFSAPSHSFAVAKVGSMTKKKWQDGSKGHAL